MGGRRDGFEAFALLRVVSFLARSLVKVREDEEGGEKGESDEDVKEDESKCGRQEPSKVEGLRNLKARSGTYSLFPNRVEMKSSGITRISCGEEKLIVALHATRPKQICKIKLNKLNKVMKF